MEKQNSLYFEVIRLLKELWPFRWHILVIAIFGIIMSSAQAALVPMIKSLFDALQEKSREDVLRLPALIIALAVTTNVSRYVHFYMMNNVADFVAVNMRRKLQEKFLVLNLNFHNNFKAGSGGLLSRMINDINIIRFGIMLVADFFREPVLLAFLFSWMIYANWKLTLVLFTVVPFVFWFLKQMARSLRKYGQNSQESMEKLTGHTKETLDGVRVIQSFNLENEMAKRFNFLTEEFLHARKKINARAEGSGPATELLATVVVIAIFTWLGLEIINGHATMGDFASFVAALTMLEKPVKKLQESYVRIQETVVASRRLFMVLNDHSLVPVRAPHEAKSFPQEWQKISYRNVSFSYGNDTILNKVSVEVKRGQVIALVGESGSGKSTLVNLLERFFDPTEGDIYIDNTPIKELDLKDLRKNIALVTQDVFLFSDSIERNIQAGDLDKNVSQVRAAAELANAHNFITHMPKGYLSQVGERGSLLSGGEKQRVSIARAIFKNAPILILDEATSALDSVSELEVQKGLETLMKGRTAFVIAHRLSTIMNADRILVLKKGQIVESGTHQELISREGEYKRFYSLQMQH